MKERLLFIAALLLSLPLAAAAFRSAFFLSLPAAFVVALVLCTVVGVRYATRLQPLPANTFAMWAVLSCAASAIFVWAMWHPLYDGLPSVGGGDAGQHVYFASRFFDSAPDIYQGFVATYGIAYIFHDLLGLDWFETFRALFYATGILILIIIVASALPRSWKSPGFPVFLFGGFYIAQYLLFPILHYLQADGFYPQLVSAFALLAACLLYDRSLSWFEKTAALATLIFFTRYTYGLNLADEVVITGIFLLLDASKAPPRLQRPVKVLGVLLLLGSIELYRRLLVVSSLVGATVPVLPLPIIAGTATLGAGLLFFRAPGDRAALFAALLGLVSAAVEGAYLLSGHTPGYYLFKYGILPSLLLAAASLRLAVGISDDLFQGEEPFWKSLLPLLLAGAGLWGLKTGYEPYRPGYVERTRKTALNQIVQPLADRDADRFIRETLRTRHARFAGFINDADWPVHQFENASFGLYKDKPLYKTLDARLEPGSCLFWNSSPNELNRIQRASKGKAAAFFSAIALQTTPLSFTYQPKWSAEPKQVTAACLPAAPPREVAPATRSEASPEHAPAAGTPAPLPPATADR